MSHFTVLVIGDDVDGQLAPFDENLEVDSHENIMDEREISMMRDHFQKEGKDVSTMEKLSKFIREWSGCPGGINESGDFFYTSQSNPDAKWDWYQIGGRWTGFFKLKKGKKGIVGEPGIMTSRPKKGYADSARKGDIDFDGMMEAARVQAEKNYDKFVELVDGQPFPPTWKEVLAKHGQNNTTAARDEYHDEPLRKKVVEGLKDSMGFFMDDPFEVFGKDKDKYVKSQMNGSFQTYAVLDNGKWHQHGDMGWFGISSNEKDESEWSREFMKIINKLPDDTLLTIVDCHI